MLLSTKLHWARLLVYLGRPEEARTTLDALLVHWETTEWKGYELMLTLIALGTAARHGGDARQSLAYCERALRDMDEGVIYPGSDVEDALDPDSDEGEGAEVEVTSRDEMVQRMWPPVLSCPREVWL